MIFGFLNLIINKHTKEKWKFHNRKVFFDNSLLIHIKLTYFKF